MKLVGAMLAYNERSRYLEKIIKHTLGFVDDLMILDNNSTDGSEEVYNKFPQVHWYRTPISWFDGENRLREHLNQSIINHFNPDYIVGVDADDYFNVTRRDVKILMELGYNWVAFKWRNCFNDMAHYLKPDEIYSQDSAPRMYRVAAADHWDYPQHPCYHVKQVPLNINNMPGFESPLIIKHLGIMTRADREYHYKNYTERCPKCAPDGILQKVLLEDNREVLSF
jgi:glycosyltransferase involved in cell wall biosynthesis